MVSRKYVGDYRLENVTDRRGKLKTVPVYRGPRFRFTADEKTLKAAKKRCLALTVLLTAALLATLLLHSELLQRIYVVMPLVLSILPAVFLWTGLYHLFTAGPALPRDKSDKIHNRFAGWSVVLLALCVLSLIGQLAAYSGGVSAAEGFPITLCTVVMVVCAAWLFAGKKDLLTEEIPSAD